MALLDGIQYWTFRGVALARVITQAQQWDEWFGEETILSIEPILDSAQRYIDVGGVDYRQLSLILAFPTLADRSSFRSYRGSVGTLQRSGYNPRSGTALLRSVAEVASSSGQYHLLASTFEALSL